MSAQPTYRYKPAEWRIARAPSSPHRPRTWPALRQSRGDSCQSSWPSQRPEARTWWHISECQGQPGSDRRTRWKRTTWRRSPSAARHSPYNYKRTAYSYAGQRRKPRRAQPSSRRNRQCSSGGQTNWPWDNLLHRRTSPTLLLSPYLAANSREERPERSNDIGWFSGFSSSAPTPPFLRFRWHNSPSSL